MMLAPYLSATAPDRHVLHDYWRASLSMHASRIQHLVYTSPEEVGLKRNSYIEDDVLGPDFLVITPRDAIERPFGQPDPEHRAPIEQLGRYSRAHWNVSDVRQMHDKGIVTRG